MEKIQNKPVINSKGEKVIELITGSKRIALIKTKRSEIVAIQQNNDGGIADGSDGGGSDGGGVAVK